MLRYPDPEVLSPAKTGPRLTAFSLATAHIAKVMLVDDVLGSSRDERWSLALRRNSCWKDLTEVQGSGFTASAGT